MAKSTKMTKTKGTLTSVNVFLDKNEMLSMPVAVVTVMTPSVAPTGTTAVICVLLKALT